MSRDRVFWGAIIAGLFFWSGLYLYTRPDLNLIWPFTQPVVFIFPAIVYPIVEEIVFRGLVQEALSKSFKSKPLGPISLANLATSVLFSGMHFIYHTSLWATAVFIPSLVFGYFKDKYQSLLLPIVLHIYYNSGYYWIFSIPAD